MAIRFRIPRRQATWALSCCNKAMCRGTRVVGTRRGLETGYFRIAWNRKICRRHGRLCAANLFSSARVPGFAVPIINYQQHFTAASQLLCLPSSSSLHAMASLQGCQISKRRPPSVICIPKNSKRVVRWVTRSWIGNNDFDPGASVCSGVSSLPTGRLACCI